MNKYIKYKRFNLNFDCKHGVVDNEKLQNFFDELVIEGYDIIYYNEIIKDRDFKVTVVCGKIRKEM